MSIILADKPAFWFGCETMDSGRWNNRVTLQVPIRNMINCGLPHTVHTFTIFCRYLEGLGRHWWFIIYMIYRLKILPVVPARGGAEVAFRDIYKTFLIYRTCMRRAPAKPVRACTLRKSCPLSHVIWSSTSHFALHTSHFPLHSSHFTLHTSRFTVHTSHFTLETSQSTLLTSHCLFHIPHSTLHTALFTPHTSHCTLHTPHFISSELFSPYPSSFLLISSSLLICHTNFQESLPSTTTKELACAVRQPGPCVRALCEAVAVLLSKNMTCARPRCNANTFRTLHIALFAPHTPHFTLALHLNSSHLSSSHLIPCLPICQRISSWLFSCQLFPSTDVYYKSLQKPLPNTNLYYTACTKHVPVLLCITKIAQSTSQYYFVLQSLHKALPSTTVYYKAWTNYFPVLLCTTKLAQRKLLHTASSFAEKLLHTANFLNREAFTHRSFYTQQAFTQRSFYTQQAFTHNRRLHTEHLHTVLLHMASVYTQKLLHKDAFTHREAFPHSKHLHTKSFTHSKLSHTASVYTQNTYTQCFYTRQAFTHRTLTHSAFTHGKRLHTQQAF